MQLPQSQSINGQNSQHSPENNESLNNCPTPKLHAADKGKAKNKHHTQPLEAKTFIWGLWKKMFETKSMLKLIIFLGISMGRQWNLTYISSLCNDYCCY